MRMLLHRVRELWCAITARCAVEAPSDPLIDWMADQERRSIHARKRRQNFMEAEMLRTRQGGDRQ